MNRVECPHCGEEVELSPVARRSSSGVDSRDVTELKSVIGKIVDRLTEIESAMDSFHARVEKMDGFLRRMSMPPPPIPPPQVQQQTMQQRAQQQQQPQQQQMPSMGMNR